MQKLFKPLVLGCAINILSMGGALAADDDSTPAKPVKCENGQVWDKKSKSCVTSNSNLIDDAARFEAARSYAYEGQFENALIALQGMAPTDDAKVLNILGYVNRKLGNNALAMDYYVAALKSDPNYLLARSYMGQALANEGKFDEAHAQLAEIRQRGGRESWAYVSLKQHLSAKSSY